MLKEKTDQEREQETIKYGIKMGAITIMVVMISFASCSMMPTFKFVDADAAKVATVEAQGRVALSEQKHKQELARLASLERLVKIDGVDPIKARCAVEGWNKHSVCNQQEKAK